MQPLSLTRDTSAVDADTDREQLTPGTRKRLEFALVSRLMRPTSRMFSRIYSCTLAICFAAQCLAQTSVINAGAPGENTAEISERVPKELTSVSPDVVVLFTGMNDAVNDKKFLSPESSRLHLTRIISACQKAHARVILVTVHQPDVKRLMQRHKPDVYGSRPPGKRISDLNKVILELARKGHLPVVDFNRILASQGGATSAWSTDGVHLTAMGYRLLANAVFEQIRKMHEVRTVLCLGDSLTFGVGVRKIGEPDGSGTYPAQLAQLMDAAIQAKWHNSVQWSNDHSAR